ncbi:hypothetical protein P692DRAFT_201867427 [Suillus brevipes Sb2]|nr:hypothetical protein P692DRAFT_201867427 [Suillus brevipes Sb2]
MVTDDSYETEDMVYDFGTEGESFEQESGSRTQDSDVEVTDFFPKPPLAFEHGCTFLMCNKSNAIKAEKAQQRKDLTRQRAHRQTVSDQITASSCIALKYESQSGNKGALAIVDTDFASEVLLYSESELSADTIQRRKKADVGKTANLVRGYQWRSVDYVAFLRWLSLRNQKPDADTEEEWRACKQEAQDSATQETRQKGI